MGIICMPVMFFFLGKATYGIRCNPIMIYFCIGMLAAYGSIPDFNLSFEVTYGIMCYPIMNCFCSGDFGYDVSYPWHFHANEV